MRLMQNVSRYKLAARWLVVAILVVGLLLRSAPQAVALASVAYFAVEGHRIQSVAGRRGTSASKLVASSGWLLRRPSLWALVAVATFYTLLISGEFTLTVIAVVFLYVAGVFSQAARVAEDESRPGDGRRGRPPEDEDVRRPEDDRQPSRTGPTGE